jgi:isoleucyl-tRNA synthetase
VRDLANRQIEALRVEGKVGSSLQATLRITASADDHALLASLGEDLRFVTITSQASLALGDALGIEVAPSSAAKCARCWHYRDDVGHDAAHPALCGRCTSNLYGAGEVRTVA